MIVVVDYGVGNLISIRNMFRKSGSQAVVSGNAEDIAKATKLLLPGMGAFDNCMNKLEDSDLKKVIEHKVIVDKIPVLGICVGLQMMMESSEEGVRSGLGWIKGKTIRFDRANLPAENKIPNMGWLNTCIKKESRLFEGLSDSRFYFAHSFHVVPADQDVVISATNYGYEFTTGIQKDNIMGVQFHPEKSHRFGMQLLKNFALNY